MTDGRTDAAILICHLKFLRGHKNPLEHDKVNQRTSGLYE